MLDVVDVVFVSNEDDEDVVVATTLDGVDVDAVNAMVRVPLRRVLHPASLLLLLQPVLPHG